ncbi:MAG: DUF547 domain-containing protein [Myxococcales bacterium]|nr:DUF547 domain-containing protein [Myxococcales bacterium]
MANHASLLTILSAALLFALPLSAQESEFDHSAWNQIVSTAVTAEGRFDYAGLQSNTDQMTSFEAYRDALASASLADLSRDEQLALLINAYNVNTVKGVLDNWPLESVLNVEGFFDSVDYTVAGHELTLNELENEKIREEFSEPRIHFAVNCASVGCPPIRREAFSGADLDTQLEEQAVAFVRASTQVDHDRMEVHVSQIFEWFGDDFESVGGYREFVASRLENEADAAALRNDAYRILFTPYDWNVNAP